NLNVFYNDIKDYLYMRDTGVFIDDVAVARMTQDGAVFSGIEAEFTFPVSQGPHYFTELSFSGDFVRARLDSNGNVPRIPPFRYGAEVAHTHLDWRYKLRVTQVGKQSDVAVNETATKGYTMLNASVDYHANVLGSDLTLFGKANNLLDKEVRNHASVLKDVAPEAGRNIVLGLRLEF
ncbi:MAG: TonB-dependent receptor, partial [Pseudomonadales bacterium]|nr:TonB-dependent receptor [Pseudomonadales bacterium]